jgi:hypothetical protein
VTVHVKNGWLADETGWHVNSLGVFTGKTDKNYLIAVLTDDNPTEQYGIDTIENVAKAGAPRPERGEGRPSRRPARRDR